VIGWTALALMASAPLTWAVGSGVTLQQAGPGQVAVWTAPPVDVDRWLAEDAANVGTRVPFRIGTALDAGLSPADHGTWQREDGRRVWRIILESPGAHWLLPEFDQLHLEPGAKLWL